MFSKVLIAAALIGSTLANPLPSDDNGVPITPADACTVTDELVFHSVEAFATKESMPIDQVCGQGYLDNFRGRCGSITDWGCKFVDQNADKVEEKEKNEDQIAGAIMTFKTSLACSATDIREAMGSASAADGKKPYSCDEF